LKKIPADGGELYYVLLADPSGSMWMMSADLSPGLPKVGAIKRLFPIPNDVHMASIPTRTYDQTPDGKRFIGWRRVVQTPLPPITHLYFVEHWFDAMKPPLPLQK
jgi:hypothetical protein